METRYWVWAAALVLMVITSIAGTAYLAATSTREKLVVSTTTSLYDTLLLDTLEDQFEAEYPIDLRFISRGTGLAIKLAQQGDADMILVHDPLREKAFLEAGYGVCRRIIAYNFFAIVGPETDVVEIKGLSPVQALLKLVEAGRQEQAKWVSRGDDSGTHAKEKGLWNAAGLNWTELKEEPWYIEAGSGMGATLQITEQFSGYTLADMGTYLKYHKDNIVTLKDLVTSGEELLNVYSAMVGNVNVHPEANFEGAINFTEFLTSAKGQQIIEDFGKATYGRPLFYPAVALLEEEP
ncbi:MAG: substrate-binding domain-containing protein, partial [Candidatus Bathyarchaeota archaeon]